MMMMILLERLPFYFTYYSEHGMEFVLEHALDGVETYCFVLVHA